MLEVAEEAATPHLLDMAAVAEEVLPPSMPVPPSRSSPAVAVAVADTAAGVRWAPAAAWVTEEMAAQRMSAA